MIAIDEVDRLGDDAPLALLADTIKTYQTMPPSPGSFSSAPRTRSTG